MMEGEHEIAIYLLNYIYIFIFNYHILHALSYASYNIQPDHLRIFTFSLKS